MVSAAEPLQPPQVVVKPPPALSAQQMRQEYVAAGALLWYGAYARSLGWAIDDVTTSFGLDLYERMLFDPQVYACVTTMRTSIIEEGLSLSPAITDKADPEYVLAEVIRGEGEAMLRGLDQSLDDVLADQLSCLWQGNTVAEVTYGDRPSATGQRGMLLNPVSIKVKPQQATSFVVDAFKNVVGILPLRPGQTTVVLAGTAIDADRMRSVLPRDKFIILSWRPRNNDPRGTSILRCIFQPWNHKQQLLPEYLKYLTQFASPSIAGFTPEGAETAVLADSAGNVQYDASGNPQVTTPEQNMLNAILTWRNSTAATFPGGSKIQPIEMQGDGSAFLRAFARDDQQITKGILTQTLTTEEGERMSRAAATVHQDGQDTMVRQAKRFVERAYYRDLLQVWVGLNWPGKQHLTPVPTLGSVEEHDLATTMAGVAALLKAGFFTEEQLPELDKLLGFAVRETGWTRIGAAQPQPFGGQPTAEGNPAEAEPVAVAA